MYIEQACRVVRYGTITVCTVRTVLVKLRRTTVIVTPYFTVITVKYGTVYGTVPSWHCQCKNGLRKASPPQHFPFPPPACSSHVLTPHLGEGPSSGLLGNSKSDAVLDSWLITNCCKKTRNLLGRNWSQTAKLRSTSCCTVAPYCTVGHRLFKQTVLAQYCTAYYGTVP